MTAWTAAGKTPLYMGFSLQEYWGGLSFPLPGDFPNPRLEPMSPALTSGLFTTEVPRKAKLLEAESGMEVGRDCG